MNAVMAAGQVREGAYGAPCFMLPLATILQVARPSHFWRWIAAAFLMHAVGFPVTL